MGLLGDLFKGIRKISNFLGLGIPNKIASWLMPDIDQSRGALQVQRDGSNQILPVVYGTQKVGGVVVHKFVTDESGGAENEFLHLIVAWCAGEVQNIGTVSFSDHSQYDGRFNKKGGGKWFRINHHLGGDDQLADQDAIDEIANWTSSHRLRGIAYSYIRLEIDKNQEVWRGEPQITAIVSGRKVFDPRTGQTQFSNNPALCLRDYLTDARVGAGLDASRIDDSYFTAAANQCDAGITVTETLRSEYYDRELREWIINAPVTTTKNIPRFTTNILIDTSEKIIDNVRELLGCFRGIMPPEYIMRPIVETTGTVVGTYTIDDITSDLSVDAGDINKRFNQVEIKFPNRLGNYETDSAFFPEPGSALHTQWLEEDGGRELKREFTFNGITNKAEALQMAEIVAKRSRFQISTSVDLPPYAIKHDVGDIIGLTVETHGWIDKPFRINEKGLTPDGGVSFALTEHEDSIYPWSGRSYDDRDGGTFLGDPTNLLAPTNLTLTPDQTLATTGTLTWQDESNAFVDRYRVTMLNTDTQEEVFSDETKGLSYVVPIVDTGNYSLTVVSISTIDILSPEAVLTFTLAEPAPPSSLTTIPKDWQIEVKPQLVGIGLGTAFEFDIVTGDGTGHTPTPDGLMATTRTFTGLLPDTLYTVYARTVNAFGVSSWTSAQETTTNTGEQIAGPIGIITDGLADINLVLDGLDTSITVLDFNQFDINDLLVEVTGEIDEAFKRREDVNNEELKRIQQYNEISVTIDDVATAVNTRIDEVQVDVDGNATAISGLNLNVSNLQTDLSAEIARIDAVTVTADGNATAISALEGQVNDPLNNTSALYSFVQQAQTAADGNASSITVLQNRVSNTETGLSAAVGRIDAVEITAGGNASAINANAISVLQGQVEDPLNNTSALYQIAQAAQTTADGNASSITSIYSGVTGEDGEAAALAKLSAYANDGGLGARAFFGTDVNDRVTGIIIDDSGTDQRIEFIADSVAFVDGAGQLKIYYDLVNDRYIFDGEINAVAGNFTGTVSGSNIVGGTINIGSGNFTVDNAGNITSSGSLTATNATISGTVRGSKVEFVGSKFMKVQAADSFGPNNLIEWYGPKAGNLDVSGNPIYSNLTKVNAITYLDDSGNAYFGGSIIAGNLTTSVANPVVSNSSSIDTGPFGSNGGQIAVVASISVGLNLLQAGTCPTFPNPTAILRLYQWNGQTRTQVASKSITGSFRCAQEGPENIQFRVLGDSLTYYDNQNSTSDRRYEAEINIFDFPTGYTGRSQRLSIVTQEA